MKRFSPSLVEAQYAYCESPLTTGSCFVGEKLLVNCELFAHILLEELGVGLPKWLRVAELYRRSAGGKVWVDKVLLSEELRKGDLFFFARQPIQHIQDPLIYCLHLGVCINPEINQVAHVSRYLPTGEIHPDGGAVYEQSVCDILKSPRYNTLVGIRRPKQ